MGKAKTEGLKAPLPFGHERMAALPLDEVVEALGVPHLARPAFWRLVTAGVEARPAVRNGLQSANPAVRRGCCEYLDLCWNEDAEATLLELTSDPDPDVRWMAAHALTCERCKKRAHNPRHRTSN